MKGDQGGCGTDYFTPYHLSRLTFAEIEREIVRFPAIVLPLGGSEPYGAGVALGVASACSEAIAAALSCRHRMLMAPLFAYGCSTPYSAFGGAAGVKPRTLTNTLCEILRSFRRQGFRLVVIIDPLLDNGPALDEAVNRLKKTDRNLQVITIALQRDEHIRAFMGRNSTIQGIGRSEDIILSLAAHLNPHLVQGANVGKGEVTAAMQERYRRWRRRGADPEQFRSLFPDGSTGETGSAHESEFGGKLFDYINALIDERVKPG